MNSKKMPIIPIVFSLDTDKNLVDEISYGVEEEGVPYKVLPGNDDMFNMAYELCTDSLQGVSVAIDCTGAVIYYNKLGFDSPVTALSSKECTLKKVRILGQNAACLVKGKPML